MTLKARVASLLLIGGLTAPLSVTAGVGDADVAKPGGASGVCVFPQDEVALNARVLQTELMVAALTCGQQQRYNQFVKTFRAQLAEHGQSLHAFFDRSYGKAGTSRMNAFITKQANDASQRSLAVGAGYCAAAEALFEEALATSPQAFDRLTRSPRLGGQHGFRSCSS